MILFSSNLSSGISALINLNPALFFICIFFFLWWIPANIDIGLLCIFLSILSIPKSKINWHRSINSREFSVLALLLLNIISFLLSDSAGPGFIYVINMAVGGYIYLLIVRSKFISKLINFVYLAWFVGIIFHVTFFCINVYITEGQVIEFFNRSGDQILKVPNDIAYFMISVPVSIAVAKLFFRRAWILNASIVIAIAFIYASLKFGGRSTLLYSLILIISVLVDGRRNFKKSLIIIGGFLCIYLYFNYENHEPTIYRLLNLSPFCDGRIPQWMLALEIGIKNFWIGAGSLEFGNQWGNYISKPINNSCFYIDSRAIGWPHNLLLEQFAFSGIFSFVLLVYLLSVIFLSFFKNYLKNTHKNYFFRSAVLIYISSFLVDLTFYRLWVSICFFMILHAVEFSFSNEYFRNSNEA
jgi:O-antigen ligase